MISMNLRMPNRVHHATGLLTRKSDEFKRFYRWVFDFVKETEERKTLDKVRDGVLLHLPLPALCLLSACSLLALNAITSLLP
jgi:hypothetical protein